eukprot:gene35931-26958_t
MAQALNVPESSIAIVSVEQCTDSGAADDDSDDACTDVTIHVVSSRRGVPAQRALGSDYLRVVVLAAIFPPLLGRWPCALVARDYDAAVGAWGAPRPVRPQRGAGGARATDAAADGGGWCGAPARGEEESGRQK